MGIIILGTILFVSISVLCFKPLEKMEFDAIYETYKTTHTSENDFRDSNYKVNINEINSEITFIKKIRNNFWIGIFYNYSIGDYELIEMDVK